MRPYVLYYVFTLIAGLNTSQEGPNLTRVPDVFVLGSVSVQWGGDESESDDKSGPTVPQEGPHNGQEKAGAVISDLGRAIVHTLLKTETQSDWNLGPETRTNRSPRSVHSNQDIFHYLNTRSGTVVPNPNPGTRRLEVSKGLWTYGLDTAPKTSEGTVLEPETRTKQSHTSVYTDLVPKTSSGTSHLEVSKPVSGLDTTTLATYGRETASKTSEATVLEPETTNRSPRATNAKQNIFRYLSISSGAVVPHPNPGINRLEVSKGFGLTYGFDTAPKTSEATFLQPETRTKQPHSPFFTDLVPKSSSGTSRVKVSKPVSGLDTTKGTTYGRETASKTSEATALEPEARTNRSPRSTHTNQDNTFRYLNISSGAVVPHPNPGTSRLEVSEGIGLTYGFDTAPKTPEATVLEPETRTKQPHSLVFTDLVPKTSSGTSRLEVSKPVSGLDTTKGTTYGWETASKSSGATALEPETRTNRSPRSTHTNQDIFHYINISSGAVVPHPNPGTSHVVSKQVSGLDAINGAIYSRDMASKTTLEPETRTKQSYSSVFVELNTISSSAVTDREVLVPVSGLDAVLGVTYRPDTATASEPKTRTNQTDSPDLDTIIKSAVPKASSDTSRPDLVSVLYHEELKTFSGRDVASMTLESTTIEIDPHAIRQTHSASLNHLNTFRGSAHLTVSHLDTVDGVTYESEMELVTSAALKAETRTNSSPLSTHTHQDISDQMHSNTVSGQLAPKASSGGSRLASFTELDFFLGTLGMESFSGPAKSSTGRHDTATDPDAIHGVAMFSESTEPEIRTKGSETISITPFMSLFYGCDTFENTTTTERVTYTPDHTPAPIIDVPKVTQASTRVWPTFQTEYATDTRPMAGFTGTPHPPTQDPTPSSGQTLAIHSDLPIGHVTLAESFGPQFLPNPPGDGGEVKATSFQGTSIPLPYNTQEQRYQTTTPSAQPSAGHQITDVNTSNLANDVVTTYAASTSTWTPVSPTTTTWTATQQTPSLDLLTHVPTGQPRTMTPQAPTITEKRRPVTQMPHRQPIPTRTDKEWPPKGHIFIVEDQPAIINTEKFQVLLQVILDGDSPSYIGLAEVEPFLRRLAGYQSQHLTWHRGPVLQSMVTFRTTEAVSWLGRAEFFLQEAGLRPLPSEGIFVGGVRVKNITVGGLQADVCSWLFSCPPGFHCAPAEGNASCRSVCHSQYCKHHGICVHRPGQAPLCQCPVGEDFWFMGQQCDLRMTRQRLAGVCFGVLAIVAVFMAIVAYLAVRRFKTALVQTKAEQTQSSYRRFNHFDELSARYWQKSWPGSEDSLENVAFSHSDELLHMRALDRPCCYHDDTLSIASTYPGSASHLNTVYPHSSQYQWDMSTCSLADGVIDSGKASDLSVCSWPIEPIQWTPFPLLQQIRNTTTIKPCRSRSYCEGMELVDMEKSRTA